MAVPIPYYLVFVTASYLLGSVPFGLVVARVLGGRDPRMIGSGNIGATNVSRSAGKAAGILTLVLDALKGAAPVLAALYLTGDIRFVSAVGFAAFFGHLYPVFLGFRGGKGVATALGVLLSIAPVATLLSAGVFVILVAVKRYVSLGSIVAAALLPVFISFLPSSKPYLPLGVLVSIFVILRHKENIKRLAAGTENRL